MKINILGLIASILVFISIILPWWQISAFGITADYYQYQYSVAGYNFSALDLMPDYWFGPTALAFVLISGVIGIVGSILVNKGKIALVVAGVFALLSIIVFAAGVVNLMGSFEGYPYVGFFLALVAAILQFISIAMHPSPEAPPAETS